MRKKIYPYIYICVCNIIHVMILEYTIYVTHGTLMWRAIGVKKKFASIQPLGSVNFVLFFRSEEHTSELQSQ